MSRDPARPDPATPEVPDVVGDDALLDRLAAGGLSRADGRDPAAEVLATVLADLEGRPTPRAAARRRTRRAAIAVPVVVALLATPSLAAATSAGDPWAPYRSALAALGLVQTAPPPTGAETSSQQSGQLQAAAGLAARRALGAAEVALAAGDAAAARQLLAEAEAALPGAEQREIGQLLGRLVALERILAAGANGVPGGPASPASPPPNGNANGLDPVKQTGPPPVASPRADGVDAAGGSDAPPTDGIDADAAEDVDAAEEPDQKPAEKPAQKASLTSAGAESPAGASQESADAQ